MDGCTRLYVPFERFLVVICFFFFFLVFYAFNIQHPISNIQSKHKHKYKYKHKYLHKRSIHTLHRPVEPQSRLRSRVKSRVFLIARYVHEYFLFVSIIIVMHSYTCIYIYISIDYRSQTVNHKLRTTNDGVKEKKKKEEKKERLLYFNLFYSWYDTYTNYMV